MNTFTAGSCFAMFSDTWVTSDSEKQKKKKILAVAQKVLFGGIVGVLQLLAEAIFWNYSKTFSMCESLTLLNVSTEGPDSKQ